MANNKKGWVMHVPVLSTSHVKQDTLEKLLGLEDFSVADYGEGAFVHLSTNAIAVGLQHPNELAPVVQWFKAAYPGEWWIRFDRDGDVIEGLPVYEW